MIFVDIQTGIPKQKIDFFTLKWFTTQNWWWSNGSTCIIIRIICALDFCIHTPHRIRKNSSLGWDKVGLKGGCRICCWWTVSLLGRDLNRSLHLPTFLMKNTVGVPGELLCMCGGCAWAMSTTCSGHLVLSVPAQIGHTSHVLWGCYAQKLVCGAIELKIWLVIK